MIGANHEENILRRRRKKFLASIFILFSIFLRNSFIFAIAYGRKSDDINQITMSIVESEQTNFNLNLLSNTENAHSNVTNTANTVATTAAVAILAETATTVKPNLLQINDNKPQEEIMTMPPENLNTNMQPLERNINSSPIIEVLNPISMDKETPDLNNAHFESIKPEQEIPICVDLDANAKLQDFKPGKTIKANEPTYLRPTNNANSIQNYLEESTEDTLEFQTPEIVDSLDLNERHQHFPVNNNVKSRSIFETENATMASSLPVQQKSLFDIVDDEKQATASNNSLFSSSPPSQSKKTRSNIFDPKFQPTPKNFDNLHAAESRNTTYQKREHRDRESTTTTNPIKNSNAKLNFFTGRSVFDSDNVPDDSVKVQNLNENRIPLKQKSEPVPSSWGQASRIGTSGGNWGEEPVASSSSIMKPIPVKSSGAGSGSGWDQPISSSVNMNSQQPFGRRIKQEREQKVQGSFGSTKPAGEDKGSMAISGWGSSTASAVTSSVKWGETPDPNPSPKMDRSWNNSTAATSQVQSTAPVHRSTSEPKKKTKPEPRDTFGIGGSIDSWDNTPVITKTIPVDKKYMSLQSENSRSQVDTIFNDHCEDQCYNETNQSKGTTSQHSSTEISQGTQLTQNNQTSSFVTSTTNSNYGSSNSRSESSNSNTNSDVSLKPQKQAVEGSHSRDVNYHQMPHRDNSPNPYQIAGKQRRALLFEKLKNTGKLIPRPKIDSEEKEKKNGIKEWNNPDKERSAKESSKHAKEDQEKEFSITSEPWKESNPKDKTKRDDRDKGSEGRTWLRDDFRDGHRDLSCGVGNKDLLSYARHTFCLSIS